MKTLVSHKIFAGQFIALSWETHIDSGNCVAVLPTGEK